MTKNEVLFRVVANYKRLILPKVNVMYVFASGRRKAIRKAKENHPKMAIDKRIVWSASKMK
jgi:hypothetical protein